MNFSLSSSILLLSSMSIFLTMSYSSSDKFLISISFSSFSEVLCFVWKVFLCLLILPIFSACFYILSIYAITVVFKNWPYVEGILCGSVAHFPLVTKARYFLVSLVWIVCNLFLWLGCNCCRYTGRRGLSSGPVAWDTLVGKASPQPSWLRGSDLD